MAYVLTLALIVVVVRVEHLLATDVWILLRGREWRRRISGLSKSELRDPQRIWLEYKSLGAGRLPYLMFGVKSFRLLAWSRQSADPRLLIRVRAAMARVARPPWRWYTFATSLSVLVSLAAYLPIRWSSLERGLILTIAFTLMAGSVAIAAEGTLAASSMRSWAGMHHAWPKMAQRRRSSTESELSIYAGSFIISCVCALALYSFAAREISAFGADQAGEANVVSVTRGAASVVSGLFASALNDATGAVGHAVNFVFAITFLAYTFFLGNAVNRIVK